MKFQGIVLAGGQSSRFGADKALARVEGLTMIERTVNLLNSLDLDPVVIANGTRDYSFLKCSIERDLIPDKGPMGGLYTACCLFERLSLVVLTCDMPALTSAAIKHLIECHQKENRVTVYFRNGTRKQPFPGIYEPGLCDTIVKFIEMEQLSMQELFKTIPEMQALKFQFHEGLLLNINKRKDLSFILKGDKTAAKII